MTAPPTLRLVALVTAIAAGVPGLVVAAEKTGALPEFRATYELARNGITVGVVERTHRAVKDNTFIFESISTTTGVVSWFRDDRIDERSTWQYHAGRPQVLDYYYHHSGGNRDRTYKLVFDRDKGRVSNQTETDPWTIDAPPEATDRQLYQLTLMHDLEDGKQELRYHIADKGEIKNYEFAVDGRETVRTPAGNMDTIVLKRVHTNKDVTVWCAPKYHYLPVKIIKNDEDNTLTMTVKRISGLNRQDGR